MAGRFLTILYLLGICLGGAVVLYGFVIFIGARPGGKLMGMAGVALGLGLIASAGLCVASLKQK